MSLSIISRRFVSTPEHGVNKYQQTFCNVLQRRKERKGKDRNDAVVITNTHRRS